MEGLDNQIRNGRLSQNDQNPACEIDSSKISNQSFNNLNNKDMDDKSMSQKNLGISSSPMKTKSNLTSFTIENILNKNEDIPHVQDVSQSKLDPYSIITPPPKDSVLDKKLHLFSKPFELGFQRKVCIRQSLSAVAVYYFPPNSKTRLRCLSDVKKFLESDKSFSDIISESNFSFCKYRIYRPPCEIVRFASKTRGRVKRGATCNINSPDDTPSAKRIKLFDELVTSALNSEQQASLESVDIADRKRNSPTLWSSMPKSISAALGNKLESTSSNSTSFISPANSQILTLSNVNNKPTRSLLNSTPKPLENNIVKEKPGPACSKLIRPEPYYPPGPKFSKKSHKLLCKDYEDDSDEISNDEDKRINQENALSKSLHLHHPDWFTREKRNGQRPKVPIYSFFENVVSFQSSLLRKKYRPPCSKFCFPSGALPNLDCQKCLILWHKECATSADSSSVPLRCVFICHNCMNIDKLNKEKKPLVSNCLQKVPPTLDSNKTQYNLMERPLLVSKNILNRMSCIQTTSSPVNFPPSINSVQLNPPLLNGAVVPQPRQTLNPPIFSPILPAIHQLKTTTPLSIVRPSYGSASSPTMYSNNKQINAKEVSVTTGESIEFQHITNNCQLTNESANNKELEESGLAHTNYQNASNNSSSLAQCVDPLSLTVSKSCIAQQENSTAMLSMPKISGLLEILQHEVSYLTINGTTYAVSPENIGDFKYIVKILLPEMPSDLSYPFKIVVSRQKPLCNREETIAPVNNGDVSVTDKQETEKRLNSKFSTRRRHVKLQVNLVSKLQDRICAARERLHGPNEPHLRQHLRYPGCLIHHDMNILDAIFYWLSSNQLMTCRLVCRKWKRIIDSSDRWRRMYLESRNVKNWDRLIHCFNNWNTNSLTLNISDSDFVVNKSNYCYTITDLSILISEDYSPSELSEYALSSPSHNILSKDSSQFNGGVASLSQSNFPTDGSHELSVISNFLPCLPLLSRLTIQIPPSRTTSRKLQVLVDSQCLEVLTLHYVGDVPKNWLFSVSSCVRLNCLVVNAPNSDCESLLNSLKILLRSCPHNNHHISLQIRHKEGRILKYSFKNDDLDGILDEIALQLV